jgi:hypothetical protein
MHYNRPGSRNSVTGVAIDYAFRVGRRSVFGYALGRLLAPTNREALQAFRRQYALLVSLPRRYREAIVEYNRANPLTQFTAQLGPTFRIHRVRYESTHSSNISIQDVIRALIDNHIPPEWVDHAYPHGIIFLNAHYTGSSLSQNLLDAIDNERIARLHRYGTPAAITEWDGWRHPSRDDIRVLHAIMESEAQRNTQQGS